MIEEKRARIIAEQELGGMLASGDTLLEPCRRGKVGRPVMVHSVWGRPSYWLVPILVERRAVGFARVLPTGRVADLGVFRSRSGEIDSYPRVVTRITANDAQRKAAETLRSGEKASEPIYVHDGPLGREAWLVETEKRGRPNRWIFVTGAGCYDRPAGQELDEDLEA
jgi:hypothetical protein